MSASLRFAIIGCGKIAPRHAIEVVKHGQLIAVCDIVKERADALAQSFNCHAYYSIDDLLKSENDLNVISICTPNGLHAEHSIMALQKGSHVLCEKPLCTSSSDALKMIDAAKK